MTPFSLKNETKKMLSLLCVFLAALNRCRDSELIMEKVNYTVSGLRVNYGKSKLYDLGVNDEELGCMANWMGCDIGIGEGGCSVKTAYKFKEKILQVKMMVMTASTSNLLGIYILDGVLIANETTKYLKRMKENSLIFKVGIEKAYHSINWNFLINIMKKIGFGDKWCKWVEVCPKSTSMSILVNGSPSEEFGIKKGIREGQFRGVKVRTDQVTVSGLRGLGVNDEELGCMANWMGCDIGEFPFTYLGLPIGENIGKVKSWKPVVEKFKNRLAGWGGGLTLGGKGVWSDIVKIREDTDGMGLEFTSSCVGEVGDRRDIRFWVDSVDNRILCDRFPRLFHLDSRKEGEDSTSENDGHDTYWNKLVPKKVNVFVWRAIKGRLPFRLELERRGIDLDSVLCACCNDSMETCTHCLVTCDLEMSVWTKLFNWWKVWNVNVFTIEELFHIARMLMFTPLYHLFGKQ
nr:reverse transcriptase domain, reverse transcriptase zinc-binding domain protein [Tanacetum cinerariifolium]